MPQQLSELPEFNILWSDYFGDKQPNYETITQVLKQKMRKFVLYYLSNIDGEKISEKELTVLVESLTDLKERILNSFLEWSEVNGVGESSAATILIEIANINFPNILKSLVILAKLFDLDRIRPQLPLQIDNVLFHNVYKRIGLELEGQNSDSDKDVRIGKVIQTLKRANIFSWTQLIGYDLDQGSILEWTRGLGPKTLAIIKKILTPEILLELIAIEDVVNSPDEYQES